MKTNIGQTYFKILSFLLGLSLTLSGCAPNTLLIAAQNGDASRVKIELEKGVNPNLKDANGRTALMKAAGEGGSSVLIGAKGEMTFIPMASRGNIRTVQMLLSHKADPKLADNTGFTALHYAAMWGRRHAVEELVKAGADMNANDNGPIGPPLLRAIEKGHLEVAQYLVSNGADVSASDEFGQTALINASYHGQSEIIKMLIENGANINAASSIGYTALMNAAYTGQYDSVKMLLGKGAVISSKSNKGKTALAIALERHHSRVAQLLRDAGGSQ